ncbi:DUF3800 domain-containing protein [Mycobacterium malmoense]|uniref:DUF3800 domain-containing protein n=1 Tax=Mycobacterium malmoense TaxID=1780 RepID=UPI0008F96D6E|nr:DUF3800 domain-containing protein [Mycobacterium malmoense]OIN79104.1 hypothetical protein BMG05_19875 [Mycobacterium malmoense]
MLLAYLDESYDRRHYWITALVCPDTTLKPIIQSLDDTLAVGEYPLHSRTELHGRDLFHGEKDFVRLHGQPRRRIKLYGEALDAIAKEPSVQIFIRGIDRAAQRARYTTPHHPHDVVLGHLLERIDEYAATENQPLLVIADEIQDAKHHRASLWQYQNSGTWGYRSRVLNQVVDTIHFSPSNSSRLLQAADLVSFLNYRIKSGLDTDSRAVKANAGLWARVAPQVRHCYCWVP